MSAKTKCNKYSPNYKIVVNIISTISRKLYDTNVLLMRCGNLASRPCGHIAHLTGPERNKDENVRHSICSEEFVISTVVCRDEGRHGKLEAESSDSSLVINKSNNVTVPTDCNCTEEDNGSYPDEEGEEWEG